ncbi:MAG: hypothetical protein JWO47_544 [Candidatus Saccharibacteria bacterium]|nr:hypothetical protein [Candidatus Saccharibacteria bacterium]
MTKKDIALIISIGLISSGLYVFEHRAASRTVNQPTHQTTPSVTLPKEVTTNLSENPHVSPECEGYSTTDPYNMPAFDQFNAQCDLEQKLNEVAPLATQYHGVQ